MQSIFSWGSADRGQLGITNDNGVCNVPTKIQTKFSSEIVKVSCGYNHTYFLFNDGSLYGCGSNDYEKLGQSNHESDIKPIHLLESHNIVDVSAGHDHSGGVTKEGKLYMWGRNDYCQLGRDLSSDCSLKMVTTLSYIHIVQVSCGANHTLALSKKSKLYAWGHNDCGQLGFSKNLGNSVSIPEPVDSLNLLPIKQIAASDKFSVILTPSGSIYTFGNNNYGQLGREIAGQSTHMPSLIKHLRKKPISYVSVGQNHVAALSYDGGVFTWGHGRFGQLGHNSYENITIPAQVQDLMGSKITQIECGLNHTLAYVASTGIVYSFGQGNLGQLGSGDIIDCQSVPKPIKGPWVSPDIQPNRINRQMSLGDTPPHIVQRIYAGGNTTIMTAFEQTISNKSKWKITNLTQCNWNSPTMIANINGTDTKEDQEFMKTHLKSISSVLFTSLPCIATSFLLSKSIPSHINIDYHGYDLDLITKVMSSYLQSLSSKDRREISSMISETILKNLYPDVNYPNLECLRLFIFIFVSNLFEYEECTTFLIFPFVNAFLSIPSTPMKVMKTWIGHFKPSQFKKVISACLTHFENAIKKLKGHLLDSSEKLKDQCQILEFLKVMDEINENNNRIIHYNTFYIPHILEPFNLEPMYENWLSPKSKIEQKFSIFNYPFLFDGIAKAKILKFEAKILMRSAQLCFSFFGLQVHYNGNQNSFHITVRRNNILGDTLSHLKKATQVELKKPFRVNFFGEDAMDEGGVMKELFLSAVPEVLNPNYGLFQHDPESRLCWFGPMIFDESLSDFDAIGRLFGLAIYNNVMIDLRFPLAMFKKLLNEKPNLDDLIELKPTIGKSLQNLLDYDLPDFEENFVLNFVISFETIGEHQEIDLKPGGSKISVTLENRIEYIDLYVDYILNKRVKKAFDNFQTGFMFTMQGKCYKFFKPIELQEAMVGHEDFDWNELRKNCKYLGEYWDKHTIIDWFWSVLFNFKLNEKKKFLRFLTGCDRVPVLGMNDIKITIQPVNAGDKHLPVAHTCYNLLDLPKYSSKEILREKLLTSIEYNEGFGLV